MPPLRPTRPPAPLLRWIRQCQNSTPVVRRFFFFFFLYCSETPNQLDQRLLILPSTLLARADVAVWAGRRKTDLLTRHGAMDAHRQQRDHGEGHVARRYRPSTEQLAYAIDDGKSPQLPVTARVWTMPVFVFGQTPLGEAFSPFIP